MTDDDDWDIDEETPIIHQKTIHVIVLVAILIIASVGTFLLLSDDEEDFPSEANEPKLHAGMDWWFHEEAYLFDYDTGSNKSYDYDYMMNSVKGVSMYHGKETYSINRFSAFREMTRHTGNGTDHLLVSNLNEIDNDGFEYVIYDFPLKNGKQWYWTDRDDNNRSNVCTVVKDVETLDGTYDTFRIRMRWFETNGDWRRVYRQDIYYSPDLGYMVKMVTMRDSYYDGDLSSSTSHSFTLVVHGNVDSDGDGLSDAGEKWFGTDPRERDTDLDGMDDLADCISLFDHGLSVNLTHVSTDDNVESFEEVNLFGEEDGADFYFDISNDETDDVLVTDPIENTDTTELDIIYRIDVPDDEYSIYIEINCLDSDDGNADDEMDISRDGPQVYLLMRFQPAIQRLRSNNNVPPDDELELDLEHEANGDGSGDYDATLRFIVSEVDMRTYG